MKPRGHRPCRVAFAGIRGLAGGFLLMLASACDDAQRQDAVASEGRDAVLLQDELPGGGREGDVALMQSRPALYAPVMIRGQGGFAESLATRISPDLADGWQGDVLVDDGCGAAQCLHWILWAGGDRRVEVLPVTDLPAAVRGAADEAAGKVVQARLDALRKERFADADVVPQVPGSNDRYGVHHFRGLVLEHLDQGRDATSVIQTWTQTPDQPLPGETAGADTVHARILTAPRGALDVWALGQVADSIWLSAEGMDAALMSCLGRADMIRMQQYIGANEDAAAAESNCHRQHQSRQAVVPGLSRSTHPVPGNAMLSPQEAGERAQGD